MDKINDSLSKAYEKIIANSPFMLNSLRTVILVGAVLLIVFIILRFKRGDDIEFLFIKLKSNSVVDKQTKLIEELLRDGKQKIQIIKLLDRFSIELSKAISAETYELFMEHKKSTYDYLLYGIGSIITKSKSNSHRVAIFVPDGNGDLKMKEGVGFSAEGKQKLRLSIQNSSAGFVFRTGDTYNSGDIHSSGNVFKVNTNAKKVYNSLACLPIKCGNSIIGVLSMDGEEKDSFDKDDMDYLSYFANTLSPLIFFDEITAPEIKERDLDGEVS